MDDEKSLKALLSEAKRNIRLTKKLIKKQKQAKYASARAPVLLLRRLTVRLRF